MAESRTVLLYVRNDTRPAFDRLKESLARKGCPLNHLLCLTVQELAQHPDPLRQVLGRLGEVESCPPSGAGK